MFTGYFDFAGREIGNAARAVAYAKALSPAMGVLDPLRTETLLPVLSEAPYTTPELDNAPWFDEDDPDTANFYGIYPLDLTNLDDSTREANVTEGIADGGFIGLSRQTTREVLVRAALYGKDEMAVNAGLTWLRETLAVPTPSCSIHGAMCGARDFSFLAARPDEGYDITSGLLRYRRYLHGVGQTSPVIVRSSREIGSKDGPCGFYATVEFAITAENPEIFHYPRPAGLGDPTAPVLIVEPATEITNLAVHPSFEQFSTYATIRQNLVEQPSGEGSVDDWAINASPGATVDATVGTEDPPAGAPFGRGYIRMAVNAKSGSSTEKVGIRYAVPVTAGKRYSFRVSSIITSITQRMEVAVEWRTDTSAISYVYSPAWVSQPGVARRNVILDNLLAPPTATRAWIRINSAIGSSGVAWPTGSRLFVDGVLVAEGQYAPPYFDGDTVDTGDVDYVWEGTRGDSKSTMRAPLPLGMIPADEAFGGGAGAAFRTQQVSLFGESSGVYQWRDDQTSPVPSFFGMGGALTDLAAVAPGLTYVASIHILSTRAIPVTLQLVWFNGAGDELSIDELPEQIMWASPGWYRFGVEGIAPATAVFAAIRAKVQTSNAVTTGPYRMFRAGDAVFIDGAMVTQGPNLYPYFDGSTLTDGVFDYQWNGSPDSSTSLRFGYDPTLDDLVDPLLPPIMEPPVPPPIPDIALPADTTWNRVAAYISSDQVFRWARVYPIISITSGPTEVRRVRVGVLPDPFAGTSGPEFIANIDRGFVISYLPPEAVVTVDSSIRKAWVQIGGGPPRDASSLLFGLDGGPMQWPTLEGGLGYVITVDTPLDEGQAMPVDVYAVRKE